MLTKALILALACAYAAALAPLTVGSDDSDCALYLNGPGRSSAYDYSINLLKGNFGYEGQNTCITYEAVNQAYLEARQRILVSQPKGDWKPEDYASVGELVLDISINLARRYGLTYEEIEKGLPLIDTSRTLIREVCPPVFSHVECRAGKYRRLDGLCNNLQHPTWGATNAPFQRLLSPLFSDGINAPRIAHSGHDLPMSRVVSRTMHPDHGYHDHAGTVMVIAWGQFMDHDYTLTGTPLDPINRNDPEECCKRPPHLKHPYCNEIRIPDDDYFYRLFGVKCIDFVRGFPSPRPGCRLGSRIPFNTLTGAIDGNTVYGVTEKFARKLRTGFGGLLRMNPVFKEYGLKDLLPLKLDIPDEGCTRPNKNMYCFEAGEIRVNEQLVLTVMHTLMAREHNRVAHGLAEVNPHWDDETLYQEARRINIAEIQHITYNEFLPILLGKDVMEKFGLVLEKEGYWNGYDTEVNPDVLAAFAAAAYRFGHSLLPTAVERWSKAHKFIASKRLSDLIRRPYDLYRAGVLDEYVMGLMNQVAQAMDDSITQEVTNHLFKKVGARFGMDLVSFNMQRGREFGLPGYMEFRKFCGLPGAESFQDLFGSMSNDTVRKYETIFEHPVDVDLWSGGVSERPLPGSMLGPTFACVIATQFSYSRRGDRFWFELPNQPSSFTPEQLAELRKSRLARVICDNTDIIDTVQLYPMVLPDHELNPRVPCRSGILPSMDFSKWAEPTPFHGTAKDFMTNAYIGGNDSNTNHTAPVNKTRHEIPNNSVYEENCTADNLSTILNCNCNNSTSNSNDKHINNTHSCNDNRNGSAINSGKDSQLATSKVAYLDTVLKYVYKKNEKTDSPTKSSGHPKNSLRKKRSTDLENLNGTKPSFIADYEISHNPQRDVEIWLPAKNTANIIKKGDLADYNIETLHENVGNKQELLHKNVNELSSTELPEDKGISNESVERVSFNNNNLRSNEDLTVSDEKDSFENKDNSEENNKYQEKINTKYDHPQNNKDENNSREEVTYSSTEADTNDSQEGNDSREYSTPKYSKPNSRARESIEDSTEELKKGDIERKEEVSEEESNSKYISEKTHHFKPNYDSSSSLPEKIQDVDLGEYERIHVNKKGEVEVTKDIYDNKSLDPAVKIISALKPQVDGKQNDKLSSLPEKDINYSSVESNEHNEPTHINDGEVKPVVEINTEVDSTESSNEDSNEALKTKLENESLETLTGVNEKESDEKSDRLQNEKQSPSPGDVKQQFERIPLNYNHAKQNKKTNEDDAETIKDNNDTSDNDGTLDQLKPRYDENLNIKFDDIHIKLPEIKLPEDILSYTYEDPPVYKNQNQDEPRLYRDGIYNKNKEEQVEKPFYQHSAVYQPNSKDDQEKEKPRFYHYSDEIKDEPREKLSHDDDNDNDDDDDDDDDEDNDKYSNDNKNKHYGYFGNKKIQAYRQKPDKEVDDDDLYEQFVRERFGKRGTFEKRLEKLTDYKTQNPHLYKKVQNILKKTEDVKEQAAKSGDPNAGYMWTLEYGEKL